ncbi:hypothetical protein M3Y98_00194800 [Aphelenchoides besseyi]|nr:hypothetical protein M3Y98_00194800 [Aphelenchoides besseyi]
MWAISAAWRSRFHNRDSHRMGRHNHKETKEKHDGWRRGARHNTTDEDESETLKWDHQGREKSKTHSRHWHHSVGHEDESEEEFHRNATTVEWGGDHEEADRRGDRENWRHGNHDHWERKHGDDQKENSQKQKEDKFEDQDREHSHRGPLSGGHEAGNPFTRPQGDSAGWPLKNENTNTTSSTFGQDIDGSKDNTHSGGLEKKPNGCQKKNEPTTTIKPEVGQEIDEKHDEGSQGVQNGNKGDRFGSAEKKFNPELFCNISRIEKCINVQQELCPGRVDPILTYECIQNYYYGWETHDEQESTFDYDNPYVAPTNVQLDSFRCKMKDVLNLYTYMTQPDKQNANSRRPKYMPFLRRNLHYMRPDVKFLSTEKSPNVKNEPFESPSFMYDNNQLSKSLLCPSLSFYRFNFLDGSTDYDFADIQLYHAREQDGTFTPTSIVAGAHFHMKLNEDLKVDIDLPNFTPDLPTGVKLRYDYLILKVEVRPDGISVSGGRRLRSVPARQAAQSELRLIADPDHPPTSQPEPKILFGATKISVAREGSEGHSVREGRVQIALVSINELNINVDDPRWLQDVVLTRRILKRAQQPGRHPFLRLEVFVDDVDAVSTVPSNANSTRATPAPSQHQIKPSTDSIGIAASSQPISTYLMRAVRKQLNRNAVRVQASPMNSSASSVVSSRASTPHSTLVNPPVQDRGGILGIVPRQFQHEMLNAPFPKRLAWCFRMSDSIFETPTMDENKTAGTSAYLASLTDPPPADIFRFTGNYCAICNPKYRCSFPTFVSLLYHLSATHPRLSFRFCKNLIPTNEVPPNTTQSPIKSEHGSKRRSNQSANSFHLNLSQVQCPGLIVSLNRNYNGVHEFDTSRHFVKRLSVVRMGAKVKRIPEAWNRQPLILVVPNLARYIRQYPPPQRLDAFEYRNRYNDGTFGGDSEWLDPHFHTRRYTSAHPPFKKLTHKRRIREYVDVNENEKAMLTLLSEFHSSFRCLLMPHQSYGWNVILVQEERELLLKPPIYMQYCTHLCNLIKSGNLRKAEWFDILARLKHGPGYDPRADPKHFVHNELRTLETQRPIQIEIMNNKKGGKKCNPISIAGSSYSWNSREASAATTDEDNSREGGTSRKRMTLEGGVRFTRPRRLREDVEGEMTPPSVNNEDEGDKKRRFQTTTPINLLQRPEVLEPTQVPVDFYDDLVCRYQFASEKQLQAIWHFCRKWTRKVLEWQ